MPPRAVDGTLATHLGAGAGAFVLVRPDAYVAAELAAATAEAVEAALRRRTALTTAAMKTDPNIADADGFYAAWSPRTKA